MDSGGPLEENEMETAIIFGFGDDETSFWGIRDGYELEDRLIERLEMEFGVEGWISYEGVPPSLEIPEGTDSSAVCAAIEREIRALGGRVPDGQIASYVS